MSKAGLAADASNVLIHVRGKINKLEHQLKWLTHSCKWCHFLFMLMLYFGLQEMLDSPWNDRFRLPLSAQEALRYWSSGSCSSFCTTKHRKAHVKRKQLCNDQMTQTWITQTGITVSHRGHVIFQVASNHVLTAENQVLLMGRPCEASGTGTGFCPSTSGVPWQHRSADEAHSLQQLMSIRRSRSKRCYIPLQKKIRLHGK